MKKNIDEIMQDQMYHAWDKFHSDGHITPLVFELLIAKEDINRLGTIGAHCRIGKCDVYTQGTMETLPSMAVEAVESVVPAKANETYDILFRIKIVE